MSTANFKKVNAKNYYAILDTYKDKDENGVMQEYTRTNIDFDDICEEIRWAGEECGNFPCSSDSHNSKMDALELCESKGIWETYGKNGNAWTTETEISSVICIRSGYYSGAILDYDIMLSSSQYDKLCLSDYDNIEDMLDDYLDILEDIVAWKGEQHKWNVGTFKLHKNNISKWLEKRIEAEITKCEEFCRENCDGIYDVYARFSNGETWYTKVG